MSDYTTGTGWICGKCGVFVPGSRSHTCLPSDELRALRSALDALLVAAEAIIDDWDEMYISPENDANWDNLTDAIERARALLYNPNDPGLNMTIEEMRQSVDEFDKAAELAEEGM